jgi:proline dehydrogenase
LRKAKQGVLFAYAVEVHENDAASASNGHERAVQDLLHSIDVAADSEDSLVARAKWGYTTTRHAWVAIKLSTLLPDPRALTAFSEQILSTRKLLPLTEPWNDVPFPGIPRLDDLEILSNDTSAGDGNNALTRGYNRDLQELYSNLVRLCTRAKERGVKVTIDAEESWYTPAVDVITLALMRRFNACPPTSSPLSSVRTSPHSQQPLIYLTLQAYLRRAPSYLTFSLSDAKIHNYAFGVKLVRGAYLEGEIEAHSSKGSFKDAESVSISPDRVHPVWSTKRETDEVYDECVRVLIGEVREDVERCRGLVAFTSTEASDNNDKKRWFDWFQKEETTQWKRRQQQQAVPRIAVLFGTHNWKSSRLVLDELVRNRLGEEVVKNTSEEDSVVKLDEDVVQRVTTGQLYGGFYPISRSIASTLNHRHER